MRWRAHPEEVQAIAFSPDGRLLASTSRRDVRLWDASSGRPVRALLHGGDLVATSLLFLPGGRLVTGGPCTLHVWDLASGKELARRRLSEPGEKTLMPGGLSLAPDGRRVRALCWWVGDGRMPSEWEAAADRWVDGRWLDTSYGFPSRWLPGDGTLFDQGKLFDLATKEGVGELPADGPVVAPTACSADGRLLAAGVGPPGPAPKEGRPPVRSVQVWERWSGRPTSRVPAAGAERIGLSPDGRLLATAGPDGVRLWDAVTARELVRHPVPGPYVGPNDLTAGDSLAFSPDGRALAVGHADGSVLLWAVRPAPFAAGPRPRTDESLWVGLAHGDARAAFDVMAALGAEPDRAVALFRKRIGSVAPVAPEPIRALIADLDHPEFPRREAAARELRAHGPLASGHLQKALNGDVTAEQRRRLEGLLAALRDKPLLPPEELREVRAVQVLEWADTAGARRLLKALAAGAPEARLTREARQALGRLEPLAQAQATSR